MPRAIRARSRARDVEPEEEWDEEEIDEYEDDEEEMPRRRRPTVRDGYDDEDDEDESPRLRRRARSAGRARRAGTARRVERSKKRRVVASAPRPGWDAFRSLKRSSGIETFKIEEEDEEIIVKFLDEEPFAVFAQHWVSQAKGRKNFVCLGEDCPLCDVGDDPRTMVAFNIVSFDDPDNPTLKVWYTGVRLAQKLEGLNSNHRTSPINRDDLYWAVTKSGTGTNTQYNLLPVTADNLGDITPLDEGELEEFMDSRYDISVIKLPSREELEELVEEIFE